jgi:conjugative transfer signal peptidase TraF
LPEIAEDHWLPSWQIRAAWRSGLRRSGPLALLVGGLVSTILAAPAPLLVWNASPSSPIGLYALTSPNELHVGDKVIAWAPPEARALAAARGYAPANVPLVKRVAAVAGDRVCGEGRDLRINGHKAVLRRPVDGRGRPMPLWQGCGVLLAGQLLIMADAPDSFDGRYFGPIAQGNVIGKARLVWHP